MAADVDLAAWIGRSETVVDTIGPTPVAALGATLDPDDVLLFRAAGAV